MAKNRSKKKLPILRDAKEESERKPRFLMEVKEKPVPCIVKGPGNPSIFVSHNVSILNGDGDYISSLPPDNTRAMVTETYVWNQDHRSTRKSAKGLWQIPEKKNYKYSKLAGDSGG